MTQAIRQFTRALELTPQHALAYANRGLAYLKLNQTIEAERDFDQALKLEPALKILLEQRIKSIKELWAQQ